MEYEFAYYDSTVHAFWYTRITTRTQLSTDAHTHAHEHTHTHTHIHTHIYAQIYAPLLGLSTQAKELTAATRVMQSSSNELSTLVSY